MKQLQQLVTTQFADKNIVILGIGITGLSCARFLHRYNVSFSVNDSRATPISPGDFAQQCGENTLILGEWDYTVIEQADVLIVSPGIDLSTTGIESAIADNCDVIGDIELFCRLSDTPILAVTGSNGKSTVVSMLNFVGNQLGYHVQLGGNIGLPVLDQIDQQNADYIVLELSSFQLETITSMKALSAAVLNVSDDHLDRHKTIARYAALKRHIYRHCQHRIFNRDDNKTIPETLQNNGCSFGDSKPEQGDFGIAQYQGQLYLMHGEQPLIALKELPLQGLHNAQNYLAVLAMGACAGWAIEKMLPALMSFKGLAHRCEVIETQDGILWVNDSKATNVGATLAAIEGLVPTLAAGNKLILIAGGEGKGADFTPLIPVLNDQVSQLVTLGKDGRAISALRNKSLSSRSHYVESLPAAVALAKSLANTGDMVLLSPACASLDMFSNYVERGVVFIKSVLMPREQS